jgi:hypothetical protein
MNCILDNIDKKETTVVSLTGVKGKWAKAKPCWILDNKRIRTNEPIMSYSLSPRQPPDPRIALVVIALIALSHLKRSA